MNEVIQRIMDNYNAIARKYEGGEKVTKMVEYYQKCLAKLREKKRDDLVLQLKEALHNQLEYAKRQHAKAEAQRNSYLRAPAHSVHSFDDSDTKPAGAIQPSRPAQTRGLPFPESPNRTRNGKASSRIRQHDND